MTAATLTPSDIIREYRLPREAVPTELLRDPEVWIALVEDMPITALIRNLATATRIGVFNNPEYLQMVTHRITDRERLRRGRVHPLAVFLAQRTYAGGQGIRGHQTWEPIKELTEALDQAFTLTFEDLPTSDKAVHITVDVSGSMGVAVRNSTLTAREAVGAMAYVLYRTYPNADFSMFATTVRKVERTKLASLAAATREFSHNGGGTDCAVPINKLGGARDAVVMLTDSQTWYGETNHVCQAMETYRKQYNSQARLVVAETAAYGTSVVDPNDALSLGCVGFSSDLPTIISRFVEGEL